MTDQRIEIATLRKDRGWSQETLATISGLSERTIQRIEKDGHCSMDSKLALASAFECSPTDLIAKHEMPKPGSEMQTDWAGAFGLFVLGLAIPVVVLLTGTDGRWEIASFTIVIGFTIVLSVMTQGARATYQLFDRTSWIVRYPTQVSGLNGMILHAKQTITNAYSIGLVASFVTALTLAIHKPELLDSMQTLIPIVLRPTVYAVLFVECWFRPYKRKMERMLAEQTSLNSD